ncbi:MAG: hypothetical protein A2132_06660 [Nitrospirae bacterium RBG_16_43_11]|nr:MAG: hypothetical protein A2132_06660 [Nitrospirae bacterium RBG_16_43_11]
MILTVIFYISLFSIFWIYIGYPILLYLLSSIISSGIEKDDTYQPSVSIMIMTYNEEKTIRRKIENTLALRYPIEQLEILVVDSSSNDRTQEIVREYESRGIKLVLQPARKGKASAIHYGIQHATGEIIISTDANAYFSNDVLLKIIPYFKDKKVGGATGAMMQVDKSGTAISKGGDLYWKIEKMLRDREWRLHSVICMSGEICAFRRSIFRDINFSDWYHIGEGDDFCLTLFIIRKGYRIAYAPDAFVWEPAPDNIKELFQQKVRIISQTIRTMMHKYNMIGAGHGFYSLFILPSRKLLPIFSPLFLVTLFFSNLILVYSNWLFSIIFVLQLIFYLLAIAGSVKPVQRNMIPRIANFFILLNFTIIMGWFNYIRGKDFTIWDKIESSR